MYAHASNARPRGATHARRSTVEVAVKDLVADDIRADDDDEAEVVDDAVRNCGGMSSYRPAEEAAKRWLCAAKPGASRLS